LFNLDPKYKSQLLAKTCRDVAQQGESKGRWKELIELANNPNFSFFLNFSRNFPKGTSRNQIFVFFAIFYIFFIFFSEQGSKKMQPQKLAPTTEVGCGLQKYSTFSKKRAKILTNFFFICLNFFLAILMKPNRAKTSLGRLQIVSRSCCKNFRFF
jgi:hypothetical protein